MSDAPAASFGTDDLDEGLRELIKPELAPGERLLWAGRSNKRTALGGFLADQAALAAGFGLTLVSATGFVFLAWFHARLRSAENLLVTLSILSGFAGALTFVGTGVAWISRAGEARKTTGRTYALTDRRAILWAPGRSPSAINVSSVPFTTIKVVQLMRVQYGDGSGDLSFTGAYGITDGFRGIQDVQRVEKLLRDHLPKSAWHDGPRNEDEFDDCGY